MCEVCERKAALADMLRPFLADGTELHVLHGDGDERQYDDLLLIRGGLRMTLTADGDEGGYFHWKPEATVPPPPPERPVRADGLDVQPLEHAHGGKDGSLSPALTPAMITERLGNVPDQGESGDGKAKHGWYFAVDGEPCGIWDFKSVRWSFCGKPETLRKLFGAHVQ